MNNGVLTIKYEAKDYTTLIPTKEYIEGYSNAKCFIKYCMECKNYGKVWVCPPFSHDTMQELLQYDKVLLVATKIMPEGKHIPLEYLNEYLRPERLRIEKMLRDLETCQDGKAFAYAGNCLYCPEGTCSRVENQPCKHPEKARCSLEAYGFDLIRTSSELFNIDLLWCKDGILPEYLTLISAFFYNEPTPDLRKGK